MKQSAGVTGRTDNAVENTEIQREIHVTLNLKAKKAQPEKTQIVMNQNIQNQR